MEAGRTRDTEWSMQTAGAEATGERGRPARAWIFTEANGRSGTGPEAAKVPNCRSKRPMKQRPGSGKSPNFFGKVPEATRRGDFLAEEMCRGVLLRVVDN